MSDVDDELLALAGGDMSSDEDDNYGGERSREASRSRTPPPKKKEAAPKRAAPKQSRRSRSDDEDEEDGEVSSPNSDKSVPMDESSSDEGSPARARDDENKYPIEGLFHSHAEKAEIMNMREVEREQLLAERVQEKEAANRVKMLRQLVKIDEQRTKNRKRSAEAADLEENQRKTSRVRTKLGGTKVGETNAALDTLKSRRAEKSERNRRREEDRERRKDRSPSYQDRYDDDRDGGGSDVDWGHPSKSKARSYSPEVKDAPMADLEDIERVRLSRSRFGQVNFYPGFNEALTGGYVRIFIGPDPETKVPVYRMALIKGFQTGKAYAMSRDQGQPILTDLYCIAAHGKSQKEWPFLACSDSRFTEAEWNRYKAVCQTDGITIPKKAVLLNKADDINKLINRQWTDEELDAKLKRQTNLRNKFNGVERSRLEAALADAKRYNPERVAELQEELDNFEQPRLAFRTSLAPSPAKKSSIDPNTSRNGLTQQERLAQLNVENRRRNAEAVRKAQLMERAKTREIEARLERGETLDNEDTSRRLRTRMKFVHDVNEMASGAADKAKNKRPGSAGSGSGKATPTALGGGASTPSSQSALIAKLQQQKLAEGKNGGLPMIHAPIMDDEIIGALDLDIDDNILD